MFNKLFILLVLYLISIINGQEELVRIAFTKQPNQIRVTWFSEDNLSSPTILYSLDSFNPDDINTSIEAVGATLIAYDTLEWSGNVLNGVLDSLTTSTTYYYAVGDKDTNKWSKVYSFTTSSSFEQDPDQVEPFSLVAYADMGITAGSNQTIQRILENEQTYDMILHIGDIAYADLTKGMSQIYGNQTIWNQFLQLISPLSTSIPYMVAPGNHDIFWDLNVYRKTWNMPSDSFGQDWYSFNHKGVQFISFSTENIFIPLSDQHTWLEKQLKSYRESNPNGWLVLYAHRPIYCSTVWDWCNTDKYRKLLADSVEYLFQQYNVDLFISGHAHAYERSLPVYNGNVSGDYNNPKGTVHIVSGAPGCQEGMDDGWDEPAPAWSSGLRALYTGYGSLTFLNSTHLQWSFVSDTDNQVQDSFILTKGYFNN